MIAAAIKRAGRFKEISLPVLWEIAEENLKESDPVLNRSGRHALRAVFEIHRSAKDREALRARLDEIGEKDLAAQLKEWFRK